MTFSSVLLGLIIGLSVAAVAAFMIMRSPSPIQDRRPQAGGQQDPLAALTNQKPQANPPLVDPNAWMNNDGSINSVAQPPARPKVEAPPPLIGIPQDAGDMPFAVTGKPQDKPAQPARPADKPDQDQIASLISSFTPGKTDDKPAKPAATPPATKPAAANNAPSTVAKSQTNGRRYLQVGAYRDEKEADAFRARMIMMGFNVEIQKARVNNMDVNRVRIGPFDSEQELKESRTALSRANINSTVVR